MPSGTPTAISRDVAKMMRLMARTIRSRSLYSANNQALALMRDELNRATEAVFRQVAEVSLRVLPDALIYQDVSVLENPDTGEGLPFALYRDGIRRLDLLAGLTPSELDQVVLAFHLGQASRSMEDDIVTHLWRCDLEHVRYVTVEVHVTDAASEAAHDQQVDAVVRALYQSAPEGSLFHGLNLDASEEAAKALADAIGTIDDLAPGFHPASALPALPAYARRLEGQAESPYRGMMTDILSIMSEAPEAMPEVEFGFSSLLDLLDAALLDEDVRLATDIVLGVRALSLHLNRVDGWLEQALSDVRLRQVSALAQQRPDVEHLVREFFEAAGSRAAPSLVQALPTFREPEIRRRFSDLALDLGLEDPAAAEELVRNEIGFAAREGIYILSRLDRLRDRSLLRDIQRHPKPQVRMALVNEIDRVPLEFASGVLSELLRDEAPRVRVAAAETLAQRGDEGARRALVNAVERPEFEEEPASVKSALAIGLATVLGPRAIPHLDPMVGRADSWMARRAHEETATAAIHALAQVQHQDAVEALKRAALSRNRTVRGEARSVLERLRGGVA
ncbi:MAG: HEAT repeat domain-containing protein [Myxococcota bacterium]